MKFHNYYSGSAGNLYTVEADNGNRLLIDPGVPWKKLLEALDYDLSNIVGCLVSHEHKDHCKAVPCVLEAGIQVFASLGTLRAMGVIGHRMACTMVPHIEGFDIISRKANHDAADPLIFAIACDGQRLLFATDTSHISQTFLTPFDIIAIECSYDRTILDERVWTGDINPTLANRLLRSHMEKYTTIRYLEKFCDLSRCKEIHLLHCSKDNLDAEATRKEIEDKFFTKTVCK